jgi:hypothetical protein
MANNFPPLHLPFTSDHKVLHLQRYIQVLQYIPIWGIFIKVNAKLVYMLLVQHFQIKGNKYFRTE